MSSKKPAISIVTPVWNGLPYIKECVESVLNQDFQDWEYIISDNGSTDGTRDYLDTLVDPRIRIFKQPTNLGITGNLNFLFFNASAEIAYCLCADDYLYPGAIRKVVNEWSLVPPDTGFIGFNWKEIIKHSITGKYSYEVLPKVLYPKYSLLAFFLFGNLPGNVSNVSPKVSAVTAGGGFDARFRMAGDYEIWSRLARTHTMVLSDVETCYVRRHEGVATNYMNKQGILFSEHIILFEKFIDELSEYCDRKKLVDYFNIEICSYHYRDSIKALLYYWRTGGIKRFLLSKSRILWPTWKRLLFCLPFALYESGRLRHINSRAGDFLRGFQNKPNNVKEKELV